MQIKAENFSLLANLIEQSKKALIITGKNPSVDTLAAGLSLGKTLTTLSKDVEVFAPGNIPKELSSFSEKISDKVGVKKLAISFNWQKNRVEKVSYSLEGEKFNFIVTPRNQRIDPQEIKICYTGEEADLVVVLGVSSLAWVEGLAVDFFENKTIIDIDKNGENQLFGKLNFVNEKADSICAIVASVIEKLGVPITDQTIMDLLLLGLRSATESFNKVDDPTTFEAAAFCTKLKGKEALEGKNYQAEEQSKQTHTPKEWLAPKVYRSKQTS
jgi:nanoRNase/pAp phosphatase (c-di-AMP/oligoRNAs hydrolase)